MIDRINENLLLHKLTGKFCHSDRQVNFLHESDSEIILFEDGSHNYLAATIDSISEEIKTGLYDSPYLIGWMSVMVNMSDLAAVGAEPIGILISEIFPDNLSENFIQELQRGISDAVNKCGTFVLGGDTNSGDNLIITGCALGKCRKNYNTRIGCKDRDILYTTGPAGRGNSFALSKLIRKGNLSLDYLPEARLQESMIIKNFASCCIDTSDGLISALDQLLRLNNLGFEIEYECEKIIDRDSVKIALQYNIPLWLLLAGEHGDFELVFTVPAENERAFLSAAEKIKWQPLRLGKVVKKPNLKILIDNKLKTLDGERIRNLAYYIKIDVSQYLQELMKYHQELMRES